MPVIKLLLSLSSKSTISSHSICSAGTGMVKMHFSVVSWLPDSFCKTGRLKEGEGLPALRLLAIPAAVSPACSLLWKQ